MCPNMFTLLLNTLLTNDFYVVMQDTCFIANTYDFKSEAVFLSLRFFTLQHVHFKLLQAICYFLKYLSILSKANLELIIDMGNPAPGTVEAPT